MPGIDKVQNQQVENAGMFAFKTGGPSPASTPSAPVSIFAETTAATACGGGSDIGGSNETSVFS